MGEDGLGGGAGQKIHEAAGGFQVLRARNDAGLLNDGSVPIGWNRIRVLFLEQGKRRKYRVGVAAGEELQGLADVLAVNNLGLDFGPETGVFERLLGGDAVGSEPGIRQRYDSNPRLSQVADGVVFAVAPEQADAADGVDTDGAGVYFTRPYLSLRLAETRGLIPGQLIYIAGIGGKEDIVRSTVADLLGDDGAGLGDEANGNRGLSGKQRFESG